MTTRRILLWVLNLIGAVVGVWALFLPTRFYDSFPGAGLRWIVLDGPYNEHLIRDVGALYLALVAAGIVAALSAGIDASRAVGAAWLVFSVPHLLYHLQHLEHLPLLDRIGQPVSLGSTVVLALPLLLPARRAGAGRARPLVPTGSEPKP